MQGFYSQVFGFWILASTLLSSQTADAWKGAEYAKNSESQKSSAEDFMQNLNLKGFDAILDVGCGDGKITAAIARALPAGEVVGVDISPSMIAFANQSFSEYPNLKFLAQDAAKIDYENRFDLITSFTVMQWVLEQKKALECFWRALKHDGEIWIQMPTGLPNAMEQALHRLLHSQKWSSYFTDFSPPWKFYSLEEYADLLAATHFTPTKLQTVTKHEKFPSRAAFHGFLKQWFPYLRPLPDSLKEPFLQELLDAYLEILPSDEKGAVRFIVTRLEVEAKKENETD